MRALRLGDAPRDGRRRQAQARVGHARAAVPLPIAHERPVRVQRPPPHGERPRIPEVERPKPPPALRDGEGGDHVREAPRAIGGGVVPPLGKHLTLKRVPPTVEQRVPERRGLCGQLQRIARRQMGVVLHARGDVAQRALPGDARGLHALRAHGVRRHGVEKARLDPGVARTARVARRAHDGANAQVRPRAQARAEELIHLLRKVRQLVDVEPVDLRALVEKAVHILLTVPEAQGRAVAQPDLVPLAGVAVERARDAPQRLGQERVLQLAVRAAEEVGDGPGMPRAAQKGVHHDGRGLAAARGPAVEHLVLPALVEGALARRGRVVDLKSHRRPAPPPRAGRSPCSPRPPRRRASAASPRPCRGRARS